MPSSNLGYILFPQSTHRDMGISLHLSKRASNSFSTDCSISSIFISRARSQSIYSFPLHRMCNSSTSQDRGMARNNGNKYIHILVLHLSYFLLLFRIAIPDTIAARPKLKINPPLRPASPVLGSLLSQFQNPVPL